MIENSNNKEINDQKNCDESKVSKEPVDISNKPLANNTSISKEDSNKEGSDSESNENSIKKKAGEISTWLTKQGLENISLENDHIGIEIISVQPEHLLPIVSTLKSNGFDYLQCQGGYDEGPGKNLVCFYNLVSIEKSIPIENQSNKYLPLKEVRIKVFLPRDGDLKVPSLYRLYKGSDWQERETFDMFGINFEGHPHPKRLLMPEDWKGWPLRKDYVQPDFYEMQDAY